MSPEDAAMAQAAADPSLLPPDLGVFGASPSVTVAVTLIFMGGCALMTGRALAGTWRPMWQVAPYAVLLGLADRFLIYALFGGELRSLSGFVLDTLILLAIAAASYQGTRAGRMVSQYPWMYRRVAFFGWRRRLDGAGS